MIITDVNENSRLKARLLGNDHYPEGKIGKLLKELRWRQVENEKYGQIVDLHSSWVTMCIGLTAQMVLAATKLCQLAVQTLTRICLDFFLLDSIKPEVV